ncbi:MAG TPA: 30S ribosomal protein S1 [Bryobacteraceae bacterium]|nr:30S ribosomal protein S1 [Bryobacteraceae bacterium]
MNDPKNLETAFPEPVTNSDETSFGDILSQFEHDHVAERRHGETLDGTVIAVNAESVFVDIGRKTEGIIPADRLRDPAGNPLVKAGDTIRVTVGPRDQEGYYQLSTIKVERPKDWSSLESAFAEGRVIGGIVTETVKGGLRVDVGVRAFMPASRSGAKDPAEMEKLIGQEIRCRITKLDTANEDVVVDRRAVLEEEEKRAREEAFTGVQEGSIVRGTVRSLMDFGAFVDIGGVDGLLHVTDMSWTRVNKPADLLKVGESLDVKVLKINRETHKISLGMKQLQPDPWTLASQKYHVGDRVKGSVSRLTEFGAFVSLEPGVDGLVHVSEMSWSKKIRKPSDVLAVGDAVEVVILGMNPAEHRVSLGLKQALGDPWETAQSKFPVGSVAEGPVTNMTSFGAFIDLGEGLEGMIHVGDITRERRLDHPRDVLKTGQVVKAGVIEVDREKRRIRLSIKQLEPTSADEYIAEHQPGETVTGRVVEVKQERVKVELGEGVFAVCSIKTEGAKRPKAEPPAGKVDLSEMTAKLNARWKQGTESETQSPAQQAAKPGQIRTFRIVAIDPGQKKIQLELVS